MLVEAYGVEAINSCGWHWWEGATCWRETSLSKGLQTILGASGEGLYRGGNNKILGTRPENLTFM